jgi:cell filamentation protein
MPSQRYSVFSLVKAGFPFAAAERVPSLMEVFEREQLRQLTPLSATKLDEQARALAVVHAEFVLIHPFREGNGRCARLLALLMALQAGLPPLDFEGVRGAERRRYIAGVHAAMGRDYEPMAEVFRRVIGRTLAGGRKRRRWLDD